jgi:hypothetical protein
MNASAIDVLERFIADLPWPFVIMPSHSYRQVVSHSNSSTPSSCFELNIDLLVNAIFLFLLTILFAANGLRAALSVYCVLENFKLVYS